mmetsp:Transcript_3826/g.9879  ORF Transcript_3826/g.9879 Transcript_3826/m.9879 type:complete len:961 (-) Transcript_3826:56-2938(-)
MSSTSPPAYSAAVNGLQIGQLVEITGDPTPGSDDIDTDKDLRGQHGQLQSHLPEVSKFVVAMVSGEVVTVKVEFVRTVDVCPLPEEGENGFDVIVGPKTDRMVLGKVLSQCLCERGFAVMKVVQGPGAEACLQALSDAEETGRLGRLAQEVEEGYLGKGTRGKVMWVDPDDETIPEDSPLRHADGNISAIAELMQACSEDIVGAAVVERTPALAVLSMTDAEEAEYESTSATDSMIEEFYGTWVRSVLRISHFMGPGAGKVTFRPKMRAPIRNLQDEYEVCASAGTVVLFREDTLEYSFEEPRESQACWLTSFFLKPGPQWTLGELEGDLSMLEAKRAGPPPPTANLCAVCAISIQATGKMTDHEKEWMAYLAGCDGQLEMPLLRFDYRPYYNEETDNPQGTTFVKHFSVQDGIELFDNKAFEISNAECAAMDPQCRQVLEVGYLSLFQVGITKKWCNQHPTHASVSVGCDKQEWLNMPDVPRSVATNNQLAVTANRFNYVFNLKGGSYVMDTACSSSLCAGHLGKVNLLERRWDPLEYHLGLGTGLTLTVMSFIGSCASHMISPSGRCLTFNATANGYNRGDGTAAMLLKAGAHDDVRMCYLRGTQIGQDGRSASMSAPNGPAQEKCTWGALREACMSPPESTTWECHGTGTSLGDPIEVGAVRKVQIKMRRSEPLMVASSKSNFGHLEGSAAAIAMNKCVMVVIKNMAASTIHVRVLNPHLEHTAFDAFFATEHTPYRYRQGHCQVSSFGVGGTNGHAIFWGEAGAHGADGHEKPDYRQKFLRKIMDAPLSIIADGPNPENWECTGIPHDYKPNDRFKVVFTQDPLTKEDEIRYERDVDKSEPIADYSTSGNFNDWGSDLMTPGDVPGLFYQEVEIPDDGTLEFRILAEGSESKSIGPEETGGSRTAPIAGPSKDLRTSWLVEGTTGTTIRIEFFSSPTGTEDQPGMRSITWFPASQA